MCRIFAIENKTSLKGSGCLSRRGTGFRVLLGAISVMSFWGCSCRFCRLSAMKSTRYKRE